MKRVKNYAFFLQAIVHSASNRQRKSLIRYASKDQILALAEVVLNFLHGNFKIPEQGALFQSLNKNKSLLRVLGSGKKRSWQKRKKAALGLGKVLPIFLKSALELLL